MVGVSYGGALALALGYCLGSIPFGLVLTRLFGAGDLRTIGSGNIGATNVLRTGNKGAAAATLVLDAAKGGAAVLIARHLAGESAAIVAGLAAFLGHLFPIWLGFRGGKGVATYIGVIGGLAWPGALVFCGVWLATAFASRYSSASAIAASVATPIALLALGHVIEAILALVMSALLLWKHSANIRR